MFTQIEVFPYWGRGKCWVRWDHTFVAGTTFHLYRSINGVSGWTLCQDAPVYTASYEDTPPVLGDTEQFWHYRLLATTPGGGEVESEAMSPRERLTRYERSGLNAIMMSEYTRFSRGDGLRVIHFPAGPRAVPGEYTDPETGQQLGPDCPDGVEAGTAGIDGFVDSHSPPRQTWIRVMGAQQTLRFLDPNGIGAIDSTKQAAHFLAWPWPRSGDIIVHVATDRRWQIRPGVRTSRFSGHYPLSHMAELQPLPREHLAYRLSVPEPLDEGKHLHSTS